MTTSAIRSPWLAQLRRERPVYPLNENRQTDVAVIGAGIAGMATTYFTLKNTKHNVILIEGGKVAHGATGHNAGQIVSYFERQLSDLVHEFGVEMAAEAQTSVDSAWDLLETIYKEAHLKTPFAQFTGYAGCQDLDEILIHLQNNVISVQTGINAEPLMVAEGSEIAKQIPEEYKGLYSHVPHEDILSLLETTDTRFVAAIAARKGCLNSALFCEELLDYIFVNFADRFTLFEESHVKEVELQEDEAVLHIRDHAIHAKKVVLCTNGFEKFDITNKAGADINKYFHHLINGRVGYMAGYLEPHTRSPIAISYLPKTATHGGEDFDPDPYFYLTRRTYEDEENQEHSLICIGGPESKMDDSTGYIRDTHHYPENAQKVIDEFLQRSYKFAPEAPIHYQFKWHGLMGYTPNGVRVIGPEPINPVLLYNLGCNGIGILPSIYGGKKISQFLNNESLPASIFDPKDSREAQ